MTTLHFETTIAAPAQRIFTLIEDLDHYERWLTGSGLYETVVEVSESPVRLGTTYIDKGTSSLMRGTVIVHEPPERIGFQQETHLQRLGVLRVRVVYTLKAEAAVTRVEREVSVTTTGVLRLVQRTLVKRISLESQRILVALKTHLEAGL